MTQTYLTPSVLNPSTLVPKSTVSVHPKQEGLDDVMLGTSRYEAKVLIVHTISPAIHIHQISITLLIDSVGN